MAVIIFSARSQNTDIRIGEDQSYSASDTTFSYSLMGNGLDACRDKLIALWGTPAQNTIGIITWKNISIDGVGSGLTVNLCDGMLTTSKMVAWFKAFKNQKDKTKKLLAIDENSQRRISVTVCDAASKNIINSPQLSTIVIKLLQKTLL
jgi:hypothetical protein